MKGRLGIKEALLFKLRAASVVASPRFVKEWSTFESWHRYTFFRAESQPSDALCKTQNIQIY